MTSNPQHSTFHLRPKAVWFLAFTAAFAVLAGFVFWGTWSLDFAPIMPDDTTVHSMAYGDYIAKSLNKFWTTGKFIPSDILWDGLLFSPYFCQELKYAFALFCAGLGVAYYCRGRDLSHLASYGAGLLLAFCGYWASLFSAGHGGWFVWMTYGVFAFGLVDRAVRKNKLKNWLFLGACVAWGSFYQPDLWLLFTVFTGLYFVWSCVRERKFPWQGMLIAGAVLFAIGAPSFRNAIVTDLAGRKGQIEDSKGTALTGGKGGDKTDDAADREARWIFVTNWSLPTDETAEFVIPRLNGDTSCPLTLSIGMRTGSKIKPYTGAIGRPIDAKEGNYRQHSIYVGWVTCILAVLGCLGGLKSLKGLRGNQQPTANRQPPTDIFFFTGAAVLFYLFSLGRYCEPVYRIVYALPFGDFLRAPVKWHHLTELALCILAAYGIECLRSLKSLRGVRGTVILCVVILLGAFDLARVDHVYCAPVNLAQVRKTNSNMQMNVLRRQDFSNPQVAEMVKRGLVVPLAYYLGNPDYYLVEMLTPRKTPPAPRKPLPPMTAATWLGVISLVGTAGVLGSVVMLLLRQKRNGQRTYGKENP